MFVKASDEELNRSGAFKKAFIDVYKSGTLLPKLPDKDRKKRVLTYVYCANLDCFFLLYFDGQTMEYGKLVYDGLVLNASRFKQLYAEYDRAFISIDIEHQSGLPDEKEFTEIKRGWEIFYSLLIRPWLKGEGRPVHFLCSFHCKLDGRKYILDFNGLYNLQYRFARFDNNQPILFTTITLDETSAYISNLVDLSFPTIGKTILLRGFKQQDREEILNACSTEEKKHAARLREKIYQGLFALVTAGGGKALFLNELGDLEVLLRKGNEGSSIHLMSHFHRDRLYTRSDKSISFSRIEQMLVKMKSEGSLRDDIILDANTCRNFDTLGKLYNHGIRYLYLSHHDISTDLAAYTMDELFTGRNACRLGWKYPYLDGKSYLHEAFANVWRCFYTIMARNLTIETL